MRSMHLRSILLRSLIPMARRSARVLFLWPCVHVLVLACLLTMACASSFSCLANQLYTGELSLGKITGLVWASCERVSFVAEPE